MLDFAQQNVQYLSDALLNNTREKRDVMPVITLNTIYVTFSLTNINTLFYLYFTISHNYVE